MYINVCFLGFSVMCDATTNLGSGNNTADFMTYYINTDEDILQDKD